MKRAFRDMTIDDFSQHDLTSSLGFPWRAASDMVMGGISQASLKHDVIDGRCCLHLNGDVRLENNGGFIQAVLPLAPSDGVFDASAFTGVRLTTCGNDETYGVHLRTPDTERPWQSYRAQFTAGPKWQTIDIPFAVFEPHRLKTPLDVTRLRRIGLVAIGRAFFADLAVARLAFYR